MVASLSTYKLALILNKDSFEDGDDHSSRVSKKMFIFINLTFERKIVKTIFSFFWQEDEYVRVWYIATLVWVLGNAIIYR